MSEFQYMFAELADLKPPDRLRQRVAMAAAQQPRRRELLRTRMRQPLLIGLSAVATVTVLAGLALVAHSRNGAPAPAAAPLPLTPANLLHAAQAHSIVGAKVYRNGPAPCAALGGSTSGHTIYSVEGSLARRPPTITAGSGQTIATLMVVSSPALAARCADQLLAADRDNPTNPIQVQQLTPHILWWPHTGAGSKTQSGVVVDGTYDIWGSVGRIMYSGIAHNRPDATALQRTLAATATEFTSSSGRSSTHNGNAARGPLHDGVHFVILGGVRAAPNGFVVTVDPAQFLIRNRAEQQICQADGGTAKACLPTPQSQRRCAAAGSVDPTDGRCWNDYFTYNPAKQAITLPVAASATLTLHPGPLTPVKGDLTHFAQLLRRASGIPAPYDAMRPGYGQAWLTIHHGVVTALSQQFVS